MCEPRDTDVVPALRVFGRPLEHGQHLLIDEDFFFGQPFHL
jgi:hypothetical protein